MILLIERDPMVIKFLEDFSRYCGCRIIPTFHPEDALRLLKVIRPRIILAEHRLPKMHGIDLEKVKSEIRKSSKLYLMVSSNVRDTDAIARTLKVDEIICKPFDLKKLHSLLSI